MRPRTTLLLGVFLLANSSLLVAAEGEYKLERVKGTPEGISDEIAGFLNTEGYRIVGPEGPVCDIWLVKNLFVKPNFSPTLSVKYPLEEGSLVGVMRIPGDKPFTDFRAQEIKPGVYTLRYSLQPQDGNHIGTSKVRDFLLAIPAKQDTDPLPINIVQQLHQKSAKASGSTHPAIYALQPTEDGGQDSKESPRLEHDADQDYWILDITGQSKSGDDTKTVPLRLVVVGESLI